MMAFTIDIEHDTSTDRELLQCTASDDEFRGFDDDQYSHILSNQCIAFNTAAAPV